MQEHPLLSRDDFRESVFLRDQHKCVCCGKPAVDAHHLIERRLWEDGGYYLNNGVSLCETHHIEAETTDLSVEALRQLAGIRKIIVPGHLYTDQAYDKWGNPIIANGQRLRGELFDDESVQKILAQGKSLSLFTRWVKYPRTHHLPWSEGMFDDDRMIPSMAVFQNRQVIATIKMDGENTTFCRDKCHARSVDSGNHPTRNLVKAFWGSIAHEIPEGWRICGENLFAKHSIGYDDLPAYFLGFSIWNEKNECLGWDDTLEWFELFGIIPVPTLYQGAYDEKTIRSLWSPRMHDTTEGYVLRTRDGFRYGEFRTHVGKFVRKNHVQTNKHWMTGQAIEPNQLKK